MNDYGFIITRHVSTEKTNQYWNHCIQCIRRLYPVSKIVVIDDNSKQEFVKADQEYENVVFIQSEFPGRGELLPFYYFFKRHFFEKAIILHDSVFFRKKIRFDKIVAPVMPLWHFQQERKENNVHSLELIQVLKNKYELFPFLSFQEEIIDIMKKRMNWFGCFGVQCVIQHSFVSLLEEKYSLFRLLHVIRCRRDRCCLERIMGVLFYKEYPLLLKNPSLLGQIHSYMPWGYTIDEYQQDCREKKVPVKPLIKVWTGR